MRLNSHPLKLTPLPWRLRAVLPVAAVLVVGLLLFFWVSLSLDKTHERQRVILVAAAGAVAI